MTHEVDVVVIGAGQAGLSSAYFLRHYGFPAESGYVVLDADRRAGGAWQHRWPSLRLDNVHGIHDLPGLPLGQADGTRPAAEVVAEYFAEYERHFALPVHRPMRVRAVRAGEDDRLLVESEQDTWRARAVVNATGTWTRPFRPYYPGAGEFRGRQPHTADYRGPEEFRGQHVVVVGGGTSAVQLLTEISEVTSTTWVTRRPPVFLDGPFTPEHGRAAVAMVERRVRAGLPPESVVGVTGLHRTPAVERAMARGVLDRLPMFDRITPDGVAWRDGRFVRADVILWCTGFRAAIDHLAPLRLRRPSTGGDDRDAGAPGHRSRTPAGGIRLDGTRAADEPRLHLVGYGPSASTIGATRAGRAAAREIRDLVTAGSARRIPA